MTKTIISFKTIHWNIHKLKKQLQPGVKFCAVLKANAYSLGNLEIAHEIEPEVDSFAIANIKEGTDLRDSGIKKPILLFGPCQDFHKAIEKNIIVSIHNSQEIRSLAKALNGCQGCKCKIHIKVNTGMNRFGISNVWQLKSILSTAAKNANIIVDGLYTHMAFEIDRKDEIDKQLKRFAPFKTIIRTHFPKAIIHAACSGSAEYIPAQFDMVRIGKIMYGGFDGYRTAVKITSKITAVQNLPAGAQVGYKGSFVTKQPTVCGIVSCGYADLVHFNLGNNHYIQVDNKPCKIIGLICMDTFMIDVTSIKSPLGKTATILANKKGLGIIDVCHATNTIACDLLCSFNFNRSEIIYKN